LKLFKGAESSFVEAVHPIICNGEVTTDAFRSIEQAESSLDLVDDAVPLVDADRKSQVPELGSQCALFSSPERPEYQMSWHPALLEGQDAKH